MDAFSRPSLFTVPLHSGLLMMIEETLISGKRGQIIICLLILKGYFKNLFSIYIYYDLIFMFSFHYRYVLTLRDGQDIW